MKIKLIKIFLFTSNENKLYTVRVTLLVALNKWTQNSSFYCIMKRLCYYILLLYNERVVLLYFIIVY